MPSMFGSGLRPVFYSPEGAEGGSGGGSGGGEGEGGEELSIEDAVAAAVQRETKGLRNKRDELLGERRELKTRLDKLLDKLGGEEAIDALVHQREKLQETELGQLLAAGKYDEWFDHRVQGMREGHERTLKKEMTEKERLAHERDEAVRGYESIVLETKVREAAGGSDGFRPEAVNDALLAARMLFKHDPKLGLVMKDEDDAVVYGEDPSRPKTLSEWLEEQRASRRHWWVESHGAGANGETGPGGRPPQSADAASVGKMSMSEYQAYRKKQGIKSGIGINLPGYNS